MNTYCDKNVLSKRYFYETKYKIQEEVNDPGRTFSGVCKLFDLDLFRVFGKLLILHRPNKPE